MPKVTIVEVAKEAKVSVGTVYRAVNGSGRISADTRKRVLETVERLGYRANPIARGLALRSKFNILVIMPQAPEIFWPDVARGVQKAASELEDFGVSILKFYHRDGICDGKNAMEILAAEKVDAIVLSIAAFGQSAEVLRYASAHGIPAAIFNEDMPDGGRLFFYGPDNRLAGRMAAELMIKLTKGKGACCTVSCSTEAPTSGIREQSFREHILRCGKDLHVVGSLHCALEDSPREIRRFLKERPETEGFYFIQYLEMVQNLEQLSAFDRTFAVIGHEYADSCRAALNDGTITALLVQEKSCQGYYPVMMMYRYLLTGEKPSEDSYYSNINIIVGANADHLQKGEYGCGYE